MRKRRTQYSQKEKKRRNRQTYLKIRRKTKKVGAKYAAATVNSEKLDAEKVERKDGSQRNQTQKESEKMKNEMKELKSLP